LASESVTVVQRVFAAINAADLEAMRDVCAQDTELWTILSGLTGKPYRGRSALADWYVESGQTFADVEVELLSVVDKGDGVVAAFRDRRRERTTGALMDTQLAVAARIREGKLAWLRVVATEAEAAAAL
jgi:ketosteroid isomerase-like protein